MSTMLSRLRILCSIFMYNVLTFVKTEDVLSFLGSGKKEYCLTNGSSAMYYTARNGGLYEGTELLPRSPYFCDFEKKDDKCITDFAKRRGEFKIVNSLYYENLPIFDMRWEDLPVQEVKFEENKLLSFTKISGVQNDENFKITISVRTKELHLLLCDTENIIEASCYWFILQGWSGTSTVLRKCFAQIPNRKRVFPDYPCKTPVVNITHPGDYPQFLDMNKWAHVTLEKQGPTFYLRNILNGTSNTIIEYTDYYDNIKVKCLLGHSGYATSYYKIHKNIHLRTSTANGNYTIFNVPDLGVQNRKICFSVMLTSCRNCYTIISALPIPEKNYQSSESIGEIIIPPSYGIWTEHKLLLENVEYLSFNIAFQTIKGNAIVNSDEDFWSFDNYRQCHEKEYRVSKRAVHLKECFLMYPEKSAKWQEIEPSYIPNGDCETWEQIGETCISCNFLKEDKKLGTCEKLRACEFTSNGSRCFCSPGSTGPDCTQECQSGTYGYGCSKQCGNCFGNTECNIQDGTCSYCRDGFEEPLCQIPKVDVILKYPPSIIKSSSTSCTVQLVNKEYLGKADPVYYLVQYQEATASKKKNIASAVNTWNDYQPIRKIDYENIVIVEGLASTTKYKIRILIAYEEQNIKKLQNAKVPFSLCVTTCDAWEDSDITIIPGNANATFHIKLSERKCRTSSYKATIYDEHGVNISTKHMIDENFSYTVTNLGIFKNYTIVFKGLSNIVKTFQTSESVPSEVHQCAQEGTYIDIVKLNWKEPREPNGNIGHYRVQYKKIRGRLCKEGEWEKSKELNVSTTSIELRNLSAFSLYIVTVYAVNNKFESKGLSIEVKTAGVDEFSEDEGFAQVKLNIHNVYERAAILSVDNLKCQNIRGPLKISYDCVCTSEWCESFETIRVISSPNEEATISNLQPYCNYTCSIYFCRHVNCRPVLKQEIQTASSSPNPIREVSVFSRGSNYVYLRWLPPYPPTGTLTYRITYICKSCKSYSYRNLKYFEPQNCSRWTNFHCVELLDDLFEGYMHTIEIDAANKENLKYVSVYEKFDVHVKESPSEPPYALGIKWHENNTIELLWNHPNITNGNLQSFLIEIGVGSESLKQYRYEILQLKDKLTYHTMLGQEIPPSRKVVIKVYAENAFRSQPATKTDTSYPASPILINPTISITNYTRTTVRISLNTSQVNDDKNNAKYVFVLRNETSSEIKDTNLVKLEKKLNKTVDPTSNLKLVAEINLNDRKADVLDFVVGQNSTHTGAFLNAEIFNMPLQEAQYYNISVLFLNDYNKKYKYRIYSTRCFTQNGKDIRKQEPSEGSGAYYALFLLLLIPIILGSIFYYKKKYESSPPTSVSKIVQVALRNPAQTRSQNDVLLLESKQPSPLLSGSNVVVKPKVSRQSTNPPNHAEVIYSKAIKVSNFEEYVKQAIRSGDLERQHSLFPRGQTQPCNYGSMKVNKAKNRYNNLVAYDHSRVKLSKIRGDEYSDYINASYIHGYNVPRAYIATQGPKSSTLVDFWRMIWQENVKHIVMLANIIENGKKKVEQYWPNINEELVFGNISIHYISVETYADFEYKIFHVTRGNEMRKLEQLHFTSWPDHGVPLYPQSLVPFLRKILKIPHSSASPIVVHCSAGVGRTGTILLSDICLRMAAKEGAVDVLNNLQKLREQRSNMVDNVEQYKLVHLIVLESLMGLHTSIPCNDIEKAITKLIKEEEYKIQMDYLKETEWQDEAMMTGDSDGEFVIYPEKNRFQDIIPDNRSRIFLSRYPSKDSSSSYINAVQVDGFRCPNRFIVTQQPMPNTLNDFWRLIVERHTTVIVSLNPTDITDKTCCNFHPTVDNPEFRPTDFIVIKFEKEVTLDHYDVHSVRVFVNDFEEHLDVDIISFKKWPALSNLPSSCEEFLSFWEEADAISRRSKTILVSCYDGKTASGVYVSLCFVIEKIKLEQECDVCLAVRNVRHNRKQFVSDEGQFIFLYEAALRYINGFESYANFQNQ